MRTHATDSVVVLDAMRAHVSDSDVQEEGCRIVCFLALKADNKVQIAREGGIAVVLEAMRVHDSHSGVQLWGKQALSLLNHSGP